MRQPDLIEQEEEPPGPIFTLPPVKLAVLMPAIRSVLKEKTLVARMDAIEQLPEPIRPTVRYYVRDTLSRYRGALEHCMEKADPLEAVNGFPEGMRAELARAVRARLRKRT